MKVYNGIESLSAILNETGCKRLLVVADASFPFLNIKNEVEALPVEKQFFTAFTPNPRFSEVCRGLETFNLCDCDGLLAIGGGSAIDVAKCIKLAFLAERHWQALVPPLVLQRVEIDGSKVPLIAIPTTAGTGSEATHNAVMYYQGAKQTVTNDGIRPDHVVLEPRVLLTLPLYQKKCTLMDALSQGIEAWWSVNATDESRAFSRQTIALIMANWERYIFDNDPLAAANILLAAHHSGQAINIAQTTAAHAMSYKLTSLYHLPHGHAVAVCLPEVWDYMLAHNPAALPDFSSVGITSETFRLMMRRMELDRPVSAHRDDDLNLLAASVNPIRLKNNPVKLSEATLRELYQRIVR